MSDFINRSIDNLHILSKLQKLTNQNHGIQNQHFQKAIQKIPQPNTEYFTVKIILNIYSLKDL